MEKRIGEFLVDFVLPEHNWKITLFKNWDRIIGSLKDKVLILKIDKSVLVLGVFHPTLAQELFMLSDMLKKRINSLFDKERIKSIRFKTLTFKKKNSFTIRRDTRNSVKKKIKIVPFTKSEYKSLSQIMDLELKEGLKSFYYRCKNKKI